MQLTSPVRFEGIHHIKVDELYYATARVQGGPAQGGRDTLSGRTERADRVVLERVKAKFLRPENAHVVVIGAESKLKAFKYTYVYDGWIRQRVLRGLGGLAYVHPKITVLTSDDAKTFWTDLYAKVHKLGWLSKRRSPEDEFHNPVPALFVRVETAHAKYREAVVPLQAQLKKLEADKPKGFIPSWTKRKETQAYQKQKKALESQQQVAWQQYRPVQQELLNLQAALQEKRSKLGFAWDVEAYYKEHKKADAESGKPAEARTIYGLSGLEKL